jgi:transposase InsO family protein
MSLARLIITAVVLEKRTKSEVAREYGVSRFWVQTLVKRFEAEGEAAYAPRSRRPRSSPQAVPAEVEEEILRLRKELAKQGLDAGAETIAAHLARRTPRSPTSTSPNRVPAVSTIWRILTRRGFVSPQPQKRPRASWQRFVAAQPNELWQADTTHWHLGDGSGVEILNLLDDHSRLDVESDVYGSTTAGDVVASFAQAMSRHGIPARVLTDNGAIFTAIPRGEGRVALELELGVLGVKISHSSAYHPQTCGKVERFHQTQKKWLAAQPPAQTLTELQAQVDTFRGYYNAERPHRALHRRTPAEAYTTRPKAVPTGPTIPRHYRVRHDTVDRAGSVTVRYNSRLHHIGVGRRLTGTRLTLLIADLQIRIINARTGELIRELILDPSKDYHGTGRPPGPPRRNP